MLQHRHVPALAAAVAFVCLAGASILGAMQQARETVTFAAVRPAPTPPSLVYVLDGALPGPVVKPKEPPLWTHPF